MGRFKPIFLAFVLNSTGVYMFTAPKGFSCFPFSSYFIFLLGVFFLLWDMKLKPVAFRRLVRCAEFLIEFIVNMMLMEIIMNNFWFPLEMAFLSLLPKISDCFGKLAKAAGITNGTIVKMFDFLKWHGTLWIASHALSTFLFLCIIHATRVVDFRILKRCGACDFIEDVSKRGIEFYCKLNSNTNCNRQCLGSGGIELSRAYSNYDDYSDSQDLCDCDTYDTSSYSSSN